MLTLFSSSPSPFKLYMDEFGALVSIEEENTSTNKLQHDEKYQQSQTSNPKLTILENAKKTKTIATIIPLLSLLWSS